MKRMIVEIIVGIYIECLIYSVDDLCTACYVHEVCFDIQAYEFGQFCW